MEGNHKCQFTFGKSLDVVNALEGASSDLVSLPASNNISAEAVVSAAAFRVMNDLYPGRGSIQAVQTAALAEIPDGSPTTNRRPGNILPAHLLSR